jgi:predicted Zn finger-like uncharacterized protein
VHYRCLSCHAKYAIPDERVGAAGPDGLRVRCSKCRAIMAVTATTTAAVTARPTAPTTALTTGVMMNPFADVAIPDAVGAVGGAGGGPGRQVTGVFLPLLSSAEAAREGTAHFWAAIAGRSRGPFTARELVMLAEKGRVRAGTLLWRPGASAWKPLKEITEFDVAWLRDAVARRKVREREAAAAALAQRGIAPIHIERHTVRATPPLPADAWENALSDAPSAIPQLVAGESTGSFEWRAPTLSGRARRRRTGRVVAAGIIAGLVVAAIAAAVAFQVG